MTEVIVVEQKEKAVVEQEQLKTVLELTSTEASWGGTSGSFDVLRDAGTTHNAGQEDGQICDKVLLSVDHPDGVCGTASDKDGLSQRVVSGTDCGRLGDVSGECREHNEGCNSVGGTGGED